MGETEDEEVGMLRGAEKGCCDGGDLGGGHGLGGAVGGGGVVEEGFGHGGWKWRGGCGGGGGGGGGEDGGLDEGESED